MDSSQTIREQLRKRRRRKFWHMVRLLVSTAVLAVTCTYVWRYVHNPAFAFGNVSIHGSSQLTEAEVISLAGCGQGPLNLFNASSGRLREALLHDVRFKNAEVAYRFPATLQVSVEERKPALYVANSYHSYLKVDYNGVVLSVTTTIPDAKAPVLAGIKCGEIAVDDKQDVKLQLSGSFPVRLGRVQEVSQKASVFMTVFNEIKDKNIKAEYIDLTFGKPYIKLLPK